MGAGFGNIRSDLPKRPKPKNNGKRGNNGKGGNNGWRDRTIIPPQGDSGLAPDKIRAAVRDVQGTPEEEAANPPTETYEDAFQSWYAQREGSWSANAQAIDYRSAIDAAVQELRAKHQNEPTNTNELLAAEKVVVGALWGAAQNVTLGINSLNPQFVVAQREKLKNLPVIEGYVGSEVRQDLFDAFQDLQTELRNASERAQGVQEICQDEINGIKYDIDGDQYSFFADLRDICMILSVESAIDPETHDRIFNPKALERFNKNWPGDAGIRQVHFGKLLQKALNNPRDPKSRKRFDDAHMREARKNLDSGRYCWPIITEEEKRNCREVAEIVVIATAVLLKTIESQHGGHSLNGIPVDTGKLPSSKDIRRFAEGKNFSIIDGCDVNQMIAGLERIKAADKIAREVVADNHLTDEALQRAGLQR